MSLQYGTTTQLAGLKSHRCQRPSKEVIHILFFDIETDNLLYGVTKIHCIVCHDTESTGFEIFHEGLPVLPNFPPTGGIKEGINEADFSIE